MANLTKWEEQHVGIIKLFLKEAKEGIEYFENEEKKLRRQNSDDFPAPAIGLDETQGQWLKFREIVINLYSVLDYTWYLLYCHFSNHGLPDLTEKCTQLGFPYKKKGIKTSRAPEHDQGRKFVEGKLRLIWGDTFGEGTHFWKEIAEVILSIQPKQEVDTSGKAIGGITLRGVEESFELLHFYRNCAAHRDLIKFMPQKSWVEINQTTREIKLVNERQDDRDNYYYKRLDKGFWIDLPGSSGRQDPSRLLHEVLQQLLNDVVKTTTRLLWSAFLLPRERLALECDISECKLKYPLPEPEIIIRAAEQKNQELVEKYRRKLESGSTPLKVTVEYNEQQKDGSVNAVTLRLLVKSKDDKEVYYDLRSTVKVTQIAEESKEAVAKGLIDEAVRLGLVKVEEAHVKHSFEPIKLKTIGKTSRTVLNEFGQKLDNVGIQVEKSFSECTPVKDQSGIFETELTFTISSKEDNITLRRLCSDKQRGLGKTPAKEAAAAVIVQKCVEMGHIIKN